jgi:hypothetical protein
MPPRHSKSLSSLLLLSVIIGLIIYLVTRESLTRRPEEIAVTTLGHVEMCISCHRR